MSRQAELAETEWQATSYHEAGHASVMVAYGLPIVDVTAAVHTPWLGRPSGGGMVSSGGIELHDSDPEAIAQWAVVALAGPFAESVFLAHHHGISARKAQLQAFGGPASGDKSNWQACLDQLNADGRTAKHLEQEALAMVHDVWDSIVDVAEELRANNGYLAGSHIYRIA